MSHSVSELPLVSVLRVEEPPTDSPKKSNHRANIIRIEHVHPHPDPETTNLELVLIGGYQVVVRKGEFNVGDLGVYIQPDSVVPQTEPFRFIWEREVQPIDFQWPPVPEKKRRITVRRFRGQWSEGLLLPVTDFPELYSPLDGAGRDWEPLFQEGEDVSVLLGITHYDPDPEVAASTHGLPAHAPRRKYPRTLRGWFFFLLFHIGWHKAEKEFAEEVNFNIPTYDVESLKNYQRVFKDGEEVIITEKIHGSNARFIFLDGKMYAGSRTQWKAPKSQDVWHRALTQNPWIEEWCRRHEGYALYGEVAPTQKNFDYGCKKDVVRFFLFDILSPRKQWVAVSDWDNLDIDDSEEYLYVRVPILYQGPYSDDIVSKLVDGPSMVDGASHMREGIVIKSKVERYERGLGRAQLKLVSNKFLERDSK